MPKLYLVYFTASWCGPCKQVKAELSKLQSKGWCITPYEDLTPDTAKDCHILVVDIDKFPYFQKRMGIQNLPTLVRVANEKPIERIVGATGLNAFIIAAFYDSGVKPPAISSVEMLENGYNVSIPHLVGIHGLNPVALSAYSQHDLNLIHGAAHGYPRV